MHINPTATRRKTLAVDEYISSLEQIFRDRFLARKRIYQLQCVAVEELQRSAGSFIIVAFSASWCKDCAEQIPVFGLIVDATGLEVRIFGGIKKDPLSHTSKWRIPPSPPEVTTFRVNTLPTIIVFDLDGKEVGRIEERPKTMPTLEQEICEIVKSRQQ
jgi:thiol-disulfide isomerase/thioredoxin